MLMMDTDSNLLFGVLALQGDLIDADQFAEACTAWSARKDRSLATVLVNRGWLSADDAEVVKQLLERKLKKHSGDAHKGLADVAARDARVHASVTGIRDDISDAEIRGTLADLPDCPHQTVQYIAPLSRPLEHRDRYTLTTLHAKGGIGQVWLARDTVLDREVALKELRPEQATNATVMRRFLQEAKVTGQLDHPGVVPIFELGRSDGAAGPDQCPYYTMRFIRGSTLSEAVARYHKDRARGVGRRVDLVAILQAFVGVCNTVAFAHNRGVLHRDLKGSNIVLGDFGEVVLLDWGLAKLVDAPATDDPDLDPAATIARLASTAGAEAGLTAAGQALGTPAFMAPEQARGRIDQIGKHTDVYGLGAILYEILAGRAPFEGHSLEEVLRQVRDEQPTPPRESWKRVPRALEAICLKAMAKEPADRYASAADIASDIRHWLANEPVSAYREPRIVAMQRWVSRHRTSMTAAAAAVVVAALGLGALALAEARANRDLAAALERESDARSDAGEQARIAREAIQLFYSGISEDVILRRPELSDLRNRLMGAALQFYQTLGESLKNTALRTHEAVPMIDHARALERVASLQALLGQRKEAIASRRKAVEIYDSIGGLAGAQAAADAVLNLGNLERLAGRPDDAIRSLREALARFEGLNRGGTYDSKVALALSDLGRLLGDFGQAIEARQTLERARDMQETFARNSPGAVVFQNNLAATYTTLGNLHSNARRNDEALKAFQKAAGIYEKRFAESPKDAYTRAELARGFNNLGLELARSGHARDGQATVERGLKLRSDLLGDQPLNIEYRSDLARSYFHLALVQVLCRKPADAIKTIVKAEELYSGIPPKGPEDIYFQACLRAMRAGLVAGGKPEPELSAAERAERLRFADLAIERLKQAVAAGYRPADLLASDPALDPLRGRLDFQEILRSVPK
jgi:serine/threonine-protein kinase